MGPISSGTAGKMLDGSSLALGGMGFVLATVALAHVERFYRRGFSRVPGLDSDPVPLRTAAEPWPGSRTIC